MASTISVPTAASVGDFSDEVATNEASRGNYVPRIASELRAVAEAAKTDVEALQGGTFTSTIAASSVSRQAGVVHSARGVVTANVASLSAFTVAGNDGLTYAEGERVLLAKQSTGSQDGIYVVGAVGGGAAPLTRAADWAAAAVLPAGSRVVISEGDAWKGSTWFASVAGDVTVGTTSPAMCPERVKGVTAAMTAGSVAVSNSWVLSASTSVVMLTAKTPGGTQGTLSHGTLTAGLGSGAFTITSSSNTDTSTVSYVVHNA